jgi:hypothetical protein
MVFPRLVDVCRFNGGRLANVRPGGERDERLRGRQYGWGLQHEVRALGLGEDPQEAGSVAACIAEYATKSTQDAGGAGSRIEKQHELRGLRCREHARRLITSAW